MDHGPSDILYSYHDFESGTCEAFAVLGENRYGLDRGRHEMRLTLEVVPEKDFQFDRYGRFKGEIEIKKLDDGRVRVDVGFGKNPQNAGRKKGIDSLTAARKLLDGNDASPAKVLAKIEELGVSETARRLEVSRPTVYKVIGDLEFQAKVFESRGPRPAEALSAINELGVAEASKRLGMDQSTVYSFIDELEFRADNPEFRFETPGGDAKQSIASHGA